MEQENSINFSMIKVLLFDCGGRQALPMCKGFSELGCRVSVYCQSKMDTGFLSKYPSEKICYSAKSKKEFYDHGLELILRGDYSLVVPLGDASAMYLSEHKKEIGQNVKVAVNDWNIFVNVIDKLNTMKVCVDNNIPAPMTLFGENILEEVEKDLIKFPVVVKPRTACGSIGFSIIQSKEKLIQFLSEYDNSNGPILVQEYIPQNGPQYGGEVFRDRNHNYAFNLIDVKPRWYPLDGGSPTINLTVHNREMEDICKRLLDALNWNGYANVDFVVDARSGEPKVLEVNGRISAAVKINYCVGIDVAKAIIENEFDLPVSSFSDYPDGKGIACLMSDSLWFIKSKDRFSTKPSWFNRRGIRDAVFDWSDIKPAIGFVYSSIIGYRKSMLKRKRYQ